MNDQELRSIIKKINGILKSIVFMIILILFMAIYIGYEIYPSWQPASQTQKIVVKAPGTTAARASGIINGIHQRTGLVEGKGLQLVIQNCTSCHSAKLIIQNRMDKERWANTIKWMQETQNLWDLGESEEAILDYLATHYAPERKGRRSQLANIKWYELE